MIIYNDKRYALKYVLLANCVKNQTILPLFYIWFIPTGEIRLIGKTSRFSIEGRLEIFHDGLWGTICGSDFGKKDARVVCKKLAKRYNIF